MIERLAAMFLITILGIIEMACSVPGLILIVIIACILGYL